MKKYLAIFAVLFTVILSSCSNDDIPVQEATVIRVNPSTVMSNFTYQLNAGDLDGVDSDEELRIRLFIYDENGKLAIERMQNVRNYLTTASFEANLPSGQSYTAIAITDVTSSKTGNVAEYWGVEGVEDLSSLRINYLGSDENYGDQEILGVKSEIIYSGGNTTINVEAAGALVCTEIQNLSVYFDDYGWMALVFGNRGNGYYDAFDNSYWYLSANPNLELKPIFAIFDNGDAYTYKFMMPQTNFNLGLLYLDADGEIIGSFEVPNITLEKGREYHYDIIMDPTGKGAYQITFGDVTDTECRSRASVTEVNKSPIESLSRSSNASDKSWKIKDLIQ